jgi:hypothetical protein
MGCQVNTIVIPEGTVVYAIPSWVQDSHRVTWKDIKSDPDILWNLSSVLGSWEPLQRITTKTWRVWIDRVVNWKTVPEPVIASDSKYHYYIIPLDSCEDYIGFIVCNEDVNVF